MTTLIRQAEAARILGVGNPRIFSFLRSGVLVGATVGGVRFVVKESLKNVTKDILERPRGKPRGANYKTRRKGRIKK